MRKQGSFEEETERNGQRSTISIGPKIQITKTSSHPATPMTILISETLKYRNVTFRATAKLITVDFLQLRMRCVKNVN